MVSENPFPLAAVYKIPPGTTASVANRLKMAKTSKVIALVEVRRQDLQRNQGSQSHRRRLRRLTREKDNSEKGNPWHRQSASAPSPSGDTTEVQALMQHPMDSGFVKDADGNLIPPHHIEVVEFQHGGKSVFTALWGPAVSKDPYVKFCFKGAQKGDDLTVSWVDNKGQNDSLVAKIQ